MSKIDKVKQILGIGKNVDKKDLDPHIQDIIEAVDRRDRE